MAARRSSRSTKKPTRFKAPASPAVSEEVGGSQDLLAPQTFLAPQHTREDDDAADDHTRWDDDAADDVGASATGEGSNQVDDRSCEVSNDGVVVRRRRTKRAGCGSRITLAEYNDRIAVMEQRIDILKAEVRMFLLLLLFAC